MDLGGVILVSRTGLGSSWLFSSSRHHQTYLYKINNIEFYIFIMFSHLLMNGKSLKLSAGWILTQYIKKQYSILFAGIKLECLRNVLKWYSWGFIYLPIYLFDFSPLDCFWREYWVLKLEGQVALGWWHQANCPSTFFPGNLWDCVLESGLQGFSRKHKIK